MGFLKMFKKSLILALILHTSYILPSDSSANPRNDFIAVGCAAAGMICAWLAYKDLKKGLPAFKEVNNQIKILNEMGVKVYKVTKTEVEFDTYTIKQNYTMKIPSDFSEQQEKKAKEHWNLLLTNDKSVNEVRGWPVIGSILLPIGIWELLRY